MAESKKRIGKDTVKIELRFPQFVGYSDYFYETPAYVQVRNLSSENAPVSVAVSDKDGLLVPFEEEVEVPFESAVELTAEGVFSPAFLSEGEALRQVEVTAVLSLNKKELSSASSSVTVLPYDWWEGLSGIAERLSGFVRPKLADCSRILSEAGERLKKWKLSPEFYGYAGADKNAVRRAAAAVFAALRGEDIEKDGEADLSQPLSAVREGSLLRSKKANALELAVFAASCLEAAGLHPVLALGKSEVGVGAWLYDSCFLDPVTDDCDIVAKYCSDGINNLCFFDVEDLFAGGNAAYTASEAHFKRKISEGAYECFVDIARCRIGGRRPLPLRGKSGKGYELIREEEMTDSAAPAPLPEFDKLGGEALRSKNRQWERRLLDLTTKNALLSFTGRSALHLQCADCDQLYEKLTEKGSLRLKGGAPIEEKFFETQSALQGELFSLELKKGLLRAFEDPKTTSETALRLVRRNREADEETGAKILYLALGFLKYISREDNKTRFAPLVLVPVMMKRAKGNEDFAVEADGEYFVNSTLLEYLKQEFNIDIRGLGGDVSALKISEILAMVLAETAAMKGWGVSKDAYLATFSFQRYLMWNDIRNHFDELKKNAVVSAFLGEKLPRIEADVPSEDEAEPNDTLIPLAADSSQYAAVALSRTGASFVLHGPPGTGKSQTITNIIANAVEDNKRVLFVAEKKAALDVVKKRLDGIGIGEFCLEIHSNKTDKADVLRRLENTLSLKAEEGAGGFEEKARTLKLLRADLKAPMLALHKKRRLGVSVYEAILCYLENKHAPDILDIESSFYDSLTERSLSECRGMILTAAAAAKECGGVFRSPFENVGLTEYSQEVRDKVFCAAEVMLTEIKHLKSYLSLYLEFYRQKISTITQRKLNALRLLARELNAGVYDKYFAGVSEETFNAFFHLNRRLDDILNSYLKHFKSVVDLGRDYSAVKAVLDREGDWRMNKPCMTAAKRLMRQSLHPIPPEDMEKFLRTLVDLHTTIALLRESPLSKSFFDRGGNIVYKKRAEYLEGLYDLHKEAQQTFLDYNPDAFNGMCVRAMSGYTRPVLEGYLKALDAFEAAEDSYLKTTAADRSKIVQEDVLDYFSTKAGALIDNIDMLANWCMYRNTCVKLRSLGLSFISDALESGKLTGENVLAGFEKNVFKNFLELTIPSDPDLARLSAGTLEDTVEKFRTLWEDFSLATRTHIRSDLISRLPQADGEGSLSLELSAFTRLAKSNLRGSGLRALFSEVPELLRRICPCMLMSPITAAQYLEPKADLFDLVIFDEASQMTTAEAVGCIARAKALVVVGDPKQLPPTAFFHSAYVDEENLENEDLESVLDDCLALGMPERHLIWHYRSRHESLIAFSNNMYYGGKLCTFPSPDALESRVRLVPVNGVYDRGFTKVNKKEAEALVQEVIRRLKDPALSRLSMGVVTFSSAQRTAVEKLLTKEIAQKKLDAVAYEREEPLFVKNLENVQGDERDVILFSVCYGPDGAGRVSLNFGPLNQAGGWRRLNVAVSRAREEMLVFSTLRASEIDLNKTSSKGVAGLKAFLEFAEKGRTMLAAPPSSSRPQKGIGQFIAEDLSSFGYECRTDVGASEFKIDVAVLDPKDNKTFLLAILADGEKQFSVKDRNILQVQSLKRGNWNVMRVNSVNYYANPKREVKRIKEKLDRLTGAEKRSGAWLEKFSRPYKAVEQSGAEVAAYITGGVNDGEIKARLSLLIAAEEPISRNFLKVRLLETYGIRKTGARVESRLNALIDECKFKRERVLGQDYYYKTDKAIQIGKFRTEGEPALRGETDTTPFEIVSLIKGVLSERVSLYFDELVSITAEVLHLPRYTEAFVSYMSDCVAFGEQKGILVRSVSDRISLA